jgi:hypothetical protein
VSVLHLDRLLPADPLELSTTVQRPPRRRIVHMLMTRAL